LIDFLLKGSDLQTYIDLNKDLEVIIFTLLALYALETNFKKNKDEWDMISSKAKKWIRHQNNLSVEKKKEIE